MCVANSGFALEQKRLANMENTLFPRAQNKPRNDVHVWMGVN